MPFTILSIGGRLMCEPKGTVEILKEAMESLFRLQKSRLLRKRLGPYKDVVPTVEAQVFVLKETVARS